MVDADPIMVVWDPQVVEGTTANGRCTLRVRAHPLPAAAASALEDSAELLRRMLAAGRDGDVGATASGSHGGEGPARSGAGNDANGGAAPAAVPRDGLRALGERCVNPDIDSETSLCLRSSARPGVRPRGSLVCVLAVGKPLIHGDVRRRDGCALNKVQFDNGEITWVCPGQSWIYDFFLKLKFKR